MDLEYLSVNTKSKTAFIDITDQVKKIILKSKNSEGMCSVYIPHTTCGVTINEAADPDVQRDIIYELNKIVPMQDQYHHIEGNSAAHIKTTLTGTSVTIPVQNNTLMLGRWQGIFLCEYDGPRNRKVIISFR